MRSSKRFCRRRGARGPHRSPSPAGPCGYQPSIAVNAAGQAIAGWDDESNDLGGEVARRTADGTWVLAIRLDSTRPGFGAVVAIDSSGVATAVWRDNEDT